MAYDKLVDSAALNSNLTYIANAIREKGGTSDTLAFPSGFVSAIAAIEAGGGIYSTTYTPTADERVNKVFTHKLGVVPNLFIVLSNADASNTGNMYLGGLFLYCPDIYNSNSYAAVRIAKLAASGSSFGKTVDWQASSSNGGRGITDDNGYDPGMLVKGANATTVAICVRGSSDYFYFQNGATYTILIGAI